MNQTKQEILKQEILSLCGTMSVSGFETREAARLREKFAPHFDEVTTDAVGNHVFVKRCGKENAPLVMVDAHFDEIGMMVTQVCEGGFLKFTSVGGLSLPVLQAADVTVYGTETLRGVITSIPPHLRANRDDESLADLSELMIDTGYPEEELRLIAPPGTPVGFAPHYTELLGGQLAGKSFDNKACAAIAAVAVTETPKEKLAADVALVFSCYEETSRLGGIAPVCFNLNPDYAMVIDVNLATVPNVPKCETVPLGKGISLAVSAATDRALTKAAQELCVAREIPHTMVAAPCSTGTNATTVNLVKNGIPVVDVGLPLKSMHTYNEVISLIDAESLCRLVEAFITSEDIAQQFQRRGEEVPT